MILETLIIYLELPKFSGAKFSPYFTKKFGQAVKKHRCT